MQTKLDWYRERAEYFGNLAAISHRLAVEYESDPEKGTRSADSMQKYGAYENARIAAHFAGLALDAQIEQDDAECMRAIVGALSTRGIRITEFNEGE